MRTGFHHRAPSRALDLLALVLVLGVAGPSRPARADTWTALAGTGQGGFSPDGGPAADARLSKKMQGLGVDIAGNLYLADGGPALAAEMNQPHAVAADTTGRILIADTANNKIRRLTVGNRRIVNWQETRPNQVGPRTDLIRRPSRAGL